MGISLKIFLVNDDDSIKRLPYTQYERLLRCSPEECFPQYAGKRVRYVKAAIEYKHRKPFKILRIWRVDFVMITGPNLQYNC